MQFCKIAKSEASRRFATGDEGMAGFFAGSRKIFGFSMRLGKVVCVCVFSEATYFERVAAMGLDAHSSESMSNLLIDESRIESFV